MKNLFKGLIVLLVALVVLIVVAKDWILKSAIETGVTVVTGFKTEVGSLKFEFPSVLQIKNLRILNPQGFEQKIFTEIPEIYASLDFNSLVTGKAIHLGELRFALKEVNVEKNKQGISNVSLLTSAAGKGQAPAAKPKTEKKAPQKAMPFQLDRFVLTINQVRYADHSSPVPVKLSANLNVNQEVFQNITDPQALVNLILLKIIKGTTFGNLGVAPELLQNSLTGALSGGQDLLKGTTAQATQLAGEGKQAVEGVLGGTPGNVANAASSAKKSVTGFLGKMKSTVTSSEPQQ